MVGVLSADMSDVFKMPSEIVQTAFFTDTDGSQSLKRLNTSVPLVPPKPKELEIATSIFASRASLAQ